MMFQSRILVGVGKDVGKLGDSCEPACTGGGNASWCSRVETAWRFLKTLYVEPRYDPAIPCMWLEIRVSTRGLPCCAPSSSAGPCRTAHGHQQTDA